jgi:archaellum component FlaG (FlaF/FlaG flagellin family)
MSSPTQAPERKGLHPLAWVGIGCGVLLVIVVCVTLIAGFFVARKVKDVASDFENNPGLAAARFIVKASPELEEVEVDEEAGTMTIRNTTTGELITVNFEDIEEGRFSWTADGEEVTVDVSDAEDGTVKIESSDGKGWQLSAGEVSDEVPSWVPIYPGTDPAGGTTMKSSDGMTGNFELTTDDPVAGVIAFYQETLKARGFTVSVNTFTGEGSDGGMVNASAADEKKSVVVVISREDGPTKVAVNFSSES